MRLDRRRSPSVLDLLVRGTQRRRLRKGSALLARVCENPRAAQAVCLEHILAASRTSTYGRRHDFTRLDSIEAFQAHVPVADYQVIEPFVAKIADGSDPHALTRERVLAFSTSSGTTADPKLIPITKGSIQCDLLASSVYLSHLARDHPNVLTGETFYLFDRAEVGRTAADLSYGSNSGYMFLRNPALVRRRFAALPYETCLIKDYEARYYTTLRLLLHADLTYLICINPWHAVRLATLMDAWKVDLLRDLHEGGLKRGLRLTHEQYEFFSRMAGPDPERARRLSSAAERAGRLEPQAYWPRLSLISSWKGGPSRFFLRELEEWYPGVPIRDTGYGSSEFRTGTVLSDEGSATLLLPTNYFYEFIPFRDAAAYQSGRKPLLLLDELRMGNKYYPVQTGLHGLVRYDVDDIIEVNGWKGRIPTIEFVQRGDARTSIAGESVYEFQARDAVEAAAHEVRGAVPSFFLVYADAPSRRYRIVFEMDKRSLANAGDRISAAVDRALCEKSEGYEEARHTGTITSPATHFITPDVATKYIEELSKKGLYDTQVKITRLKGDFARDLSVLGLESAGDESHR
jgi:hypothetical protein